MGLFAIDTEYVGPGLPLWLPKGTAIVEELEKLAKETEFAAGYVRVKTPHIAQGENVSNLRPSAVLYAESMFPPMEIWIPRTFGRIFSELKQTIKKLLKEFGLLRLLQEFEMNHRVSVITQLCWSKKAKRQRVLMN